MSHVLLEKTDHLSDTIYKYQKGKHVMATPSNLVLRSDLDFDAGKREVILDTWDRQVAEGQVAVRTNADVTGISGQAGAFTLTLQDGSTVEAEAVVLAIGTQGNPNLLRLPGGDLPHVQYQLDDPTEYVDEHITVIGSGDAGIENALGLAADEAQGNVAPVKLFHGRAGVEHHHQRAGRAGSSPEPRLQPRIVPLVRVLGPLCPHHGREGPFDSHARVGNPMPEEPCVHRGF